MLASTTLRKSHMKPHDILSDDASHIELDGIVLRKGSVGAFLASAKAWTDPASDDGVREQGEVDIRALLPGLHALGLFHILEVRDPSLQRLVNENHGGQPRVEWVPPSGAGHESGLIALGHAKPTADQGKAGRTYDRCSSLGA